MESLDLRYPVVSEERLAELKVAKQMLESEIAPHLLINKKNDKVKSKTTEVKAPKAAKETKGKKTKS